MLNAVHAIFARTDLKKIIYLKLNLVRCIGIARVVAGLQGDVIGPMACR